MSVWIQILNVAANGDYANATKMQFDLASELRFTVPMSEYEHCRYDGPLVKAVMHFFRSLRGTPDHIIATSRAEDFVDYVLDLFIAKIRRTVALVEFCKAFPELDINGIAERFTGWEGLKRDTNFRVAWVAEHLNSMNAVGVLLPKNSIAVVEAIAMHFEEPFGFNEKFLLKKWKIDGNWEDFKEDEDLGANFLCIDATETNSGAAFEAYDYGAIPKSKLTSDVPYNHIEEQFDWHEIAKSLSRDLEGVLKKFHSNKPKEGFPPIAWHSVWWHIHDSYRAIPLALSAKYPICENDTLLANHITRHYPDVVKVNRLNIQRRRSLLRNSCEDRVLAVLREKIHSQSVKKRSW
jgi:hypothetical protein